MKMKDFEISEIERIESSIKNNSLTNGDFSQKKIKIKKRTIIQIVKDFIDKEITNPELKTRLLSNINEFQIFYGVGGSNEVVDSKNGSHKIKRNVGIGQRRLFGYVLTDLKTIRGFVHELAHSITQKFDLKRIETFGNPHEKDQSIGEIESKFIEKCFDDYVMQNLDSISKMLGISKSELEEQVESLKIYDDLDLLGKIEEIKKSGYQDEYKNRYVIGEVVSRIAFREFKGDKQKMYDVFNEYTKSNADMNRDEAVKYLSEGKYSTYGEIVDAFVSSTSSVEKVSVEEIKSLGYGEKSSLPIDTSRTNHHETSKEIVDKQKGE